MSHLAILFRCIPAITLYVTALTFMPCFGDKPMITSRGFGTRSLGMGNSFVSLASDFSAVYWNPAGLGFVPTREINIGLEGVRNSAESVLDASSDQASNQRLIIGHAGLLRAIPTTQGGCAFAIGFSTPYRFDNVNNFSGWDTHTGKGRYSYYYDEVDSLGNPVPDTLYPGEMLYYKQNGVRGYGSLGMINMAVGWQIGPSLGFGFAVSPIFGREFAEIRSETYKPDRITDELEMFQNSSEEIRRSYRGIDARVGLLYAPAGIVHIGARIVAPQFIRMYQKYAFYDMTYGLLEDAEDEADIVSSLSGAVGASVHLPFIIISAETDFRSPFADAKSGTPQAYWRVGMAGGIEAPVPKTPLALRAGYSWHEPDFAPYKIVWDNPATDILENGSAAYIDHTTDVHTITAGMAAVIKNYMALEIGYGYSFWSYRFVDPDWMNAVAEDHVSHKAIISFSFHY